ncbi:TonB-dependent receptor domain-containing protein [Sulfuriflexus sp.]|uniref:TonB-dependent receptor domain-containing protein n=1 Tax=Sulfuriflexus sp. TaxID=2015443 RepID=UPI0028CE813D|nr:TonB-dependent receptor [Sulfuriflexus sp.]MDT8402994.1 TonB-dependent receptor [Sulfuriflexus sp.]
MHKFHKALLTSLVLAAISPVSADQKNLEPVIVTASRTVQTVDEALAPVIVISRDEIERSQAVDIADLLRFHAGLDIARNGNPGSVTSLFIRGTESNHTLVMIDGVKINPGTTGGAALNNIDPEMIERIEVVKGPRSALYGSEAIGGVINIITRRAPAGTTVDAQLGFGADQTRRLGAGLRYADDRLRAGLQFKVEQTEGFAPLVVSTEDRGFENLSINTFAGLTLGSGTDIELSHWQASGNSEYVNTFFAPYPPLDQDFRNTATALTFKTAPTDNWSTTFKLSHILDDIQQTQSVDYVRTRRNVFDWQNDIEVNRHHLVSAGISLSREQTDSLSFGSAFDVDTDTDAVFVQDNISYGNHQLLLAARHSDHSSFGNYDTWNVEYGYQLNPGLRLLAGVGTAFRAPDSTDRFIAFSGNPDLEPEESRNVELGLRYKPDSRNQYSLSLFNNRIHNLIDFDGSFVLQNIGKARIRGIEAAWQYTAAPWDIRVEAIAQDPENLDNDEQLSRRAKRSLTTAFGYTRNNYRLGLDILTTSSRDNSGFDSVRLPGYTLANLTGSYKLDKTLAFNARVENLFDKEYALAATGAGNYSSRDRAVFLELRYSTNQ